MNHHTRTLLRALAALTLTVPFVSTVHAANQFFAGPGAWDTQTANWGTVTGGPYTSLYTSSTNTTPTFQGTAGTVTVGTVSSGNITITTGGYSFTGGTLTLGGSRTITNTGDLSISTTLAGTNGVNFTGGNITLLGANTFTGTAGIGTSGTKVTVSNIGTTGDLTSSFGLGSNTLNIGQGGTLVYTGTGETTARTIQQSNSFGTVTLNQSGTGNLKFSGTFIATAGNHTIALAGSTAGTGEISGVLSNYGAFVTNLTKAGTGTWTLSGDNTYTSTTAVTAGTLLINGNQSAATGAVTVSAGATLGGSGTIGGATTIANGAFLAAGNSPGVLSFASSLTLNATSTTTLGLAGNGGVAGTDFDQINVTGALSFNGTLNIVSFGGYDLNQTATYDLFDFGSSTGNFASVSIASTALTNNLGIWSGSTAGGAVNYSFSQADGILTVSAVPEPSTYAALAGLGILGFAVYRRRTGAR